MAVFQRIDQAGYQLPIDERILADTDTLMVFGLDHLLCEQAAAPEEVAAIRQWLQREGTCLLMAPHHDVGFTGDMEQRQMEYLHHGDPLVPRQQRFGQYTRSLMKALGVPVHNIWGLRPALVTGTREIAPLNAFRDLDGLGLLTDVPTLNFHPHLPHYELTAPDSKSIQVLAQQPIDLDRPHPFTGPAPPSSTPCSGCRRRRTRRRHLWSTPTHFTTLFGGTDSLVNFWRKPLHDEVSCETMAKPIFNLARVCTRPVRQSIFDFARYASIAGALCATEFRFSPARTRRIWRTRPATIRRTLWERSNCSIASQQRRGRARPRARPNRSTPIHCSHGSRPRSELRRSGNWLSGSRSPSSGQIR